MITSILVALVIGVLSCNAALPKPERTLGFVARGKGRTIKVLKTAQVVNVNVFGLREFPLNDDEVSLSKELEDMISDLLASNIFSDMPETVKDTIRLLSFDFRFAQERTSHLALVYGRLESYTPEGYIEKEERTQPSNTKTKCYFDLPDLSVETPMRKLIDSVRHLNTVLGPVSTILGTANAVVTEAQSASVIAALQTTANYLKLNLLELIENIEEREQTFAMARTERIHPKLLAAITNAECEGEYTVEEAEVMDVAFLGSKVEIFVQIYNFEKTRLANDLIPIPYLLDNVTYVVDLGNDPIYVPLTARLLDTSSCVPRGDTYLCHQLKSREDSCLISLLDNPDKIPKSCVFKTVKATETPLVVQADNFTLVAQRSETPCIVTLNRDVVTDNPVMISHRHNLTVVSGSTELNIKGFRSVKTTILATRFSKEFLTKLLRPKVHFWRKWIPDSYSDYAHISTIAGVVLLFLPILYKCCLCSAKCCGYERDPRDAPWYRPRWFVPIEQLPRSSAMADPEVDSFQLRPILRRTNSESLLRDARQLTVEEFLQKHGNSSEVQEMQELMRRARYAPRETGARCRFE